MHCSTVWSCTCCFTTRWQQPKQAAKPPRASPFPLVPLKIAEPSQPSDCSAYLSVSTSSLVMTVLCSAVHSWDFRTFISTSSCRGEKPLVPSVLIRGTREQQREKEIMMFCTVQTFLRIPMWSTTPHVLSVKTSVKPGSLCNPFCLPQQGRCGTASWSFLSRASASLPDTSPTCPPWVMGCRELSEWC